MEELLTNAVEDDKEETFEILQQPEDDDDEEEDNQNYEVIGRYFEFRVEVIFIHFSFNFRNHKCIKLCFLFKTLIENFFLFFIYLRNY